MTEEPARAGGEERARVLPTRYDLDRIAQLSGLVRAEARGDADDDATPSGVASE